MKFKFAIIIILLFTNFVFARDQHKTGIHIIIKNESSQDQQAFVTLSTLRSYEIDSVWIDSPERVKMWRGVRLCDVLGGELGVECQDIVKLVVSADDGYSSVISDDLLNGLENGMCAFPLTENSPWDEKYGYMRIIFPDLRRMYWVSSPTKVIITLGHGKIHSESLKFYTLSSHIFKKIIEKDLRGIDYFAYEDLSLTLVDDVIDFTVLSRDSLLRNYSVTKNISKKLLFHKRSDGTWGIDGIDIPPGLRTRHIISVILGMNHVFLKEFTEHEHHVWKTVYHDETIPKKYHSDNKSYKIKYIFSDSSSKILIKNLEFDTDIYEIFHNEFERHRNLEAIELFPMNSE